ncbi:MAG: hypothetical protein MJZ19_01045 [Paludibacteraceae bacterium]|nr:hypothetical protein [Paludibacteraceae bacterium]
MRKAFTFILPFIVSVSIYSRDISIHGMAVDSVGNPLAYTDILLKGSNLKIMSDAAGKFDVKVTPLQRITFLWCNYKPVRTRIMRSKEVKVIMSVNKSSIIKIK